MELDKVLKHLVDALAKGRFREVKSFAPLDVPLELLVGELPRGDRCVGGLGALDGWRCRLLPESRLRRGSIGDGGSVGGFEPTKAFLQLINTLLIILL